MNLDHADAYVKALFDSHPQHAKKYMYREKYSHTKRVLAWVKRLLQTEEADADVLLCAAIFHDVGYVVSAETHPEISAEICREYLAENGYDVEFIRRVASCVHNHANRALLWEDTTPKEVILLIEADSLDEEGAMSIVRDMLDEGRTGCDNYEKAYNRLLGRWFLSKPDYKCNFVTETGKNIWNQKVRLYNDFIASLKTDLGE